MTAYQVRKTTNQQKEHKTMSHYITFQPSASTPTYFIYITPKELRQFEQLDCMFNRGEAHKNDSNLYFTTLLNWCKSWLGKNGLDTNVEINVRQIFISEHKKCVLEEVSLISSKIATILRH